MAAPKIANLKEEDGIMTFTISNLDVSYVNALRRTILTDIQTLAFKTTPYEENKANIIHNTSRLNNEIIKQRLSCIPICISEFEIMPLKNYLLELDVENNTDTVMIVTTKDFKIRNLVTNEFLDDGKVKQIFPPFLAPNGQEYFIDFVKLRPKISDEIPGERIKLTCEFSVSSARDDSMFNVTGTCSYGYTPDKEIMEAQLEIRKQKWKDEGKDVKFEVANWKLLEGLRYYKENSFDFVIGTVGIYENTRIIILACEILNAKMELLKKIISEDEIKIIVSDNTMENSYDIILENEDYTIGNILNSELYKIFYSELGQLDYVGFKKMHPHDNDSIIRVALTDKTKGVSTIKIMLDAVSEQAMKTLKGVKGCFDGSREGEK